MKDARTILFALPLVLAGCSLDPEVTDTGYVGTWSRGSERALSTVMIRTNGERHFFKPHVVNRSVGLELKCEWDGTCTEWKAGAKVRTFRFDVREDPDSGHLLVEYDIHLVDTGEREFHYLDELVLEEGGLALTAYTTERNGTVFEGGSRPKREFRKISDETSPLD